MEYNLRDINSSKTYFTGSIWKTSNFGNITVLGQINEKDKKNEYLKFLVVFDDGTKKITTKNNIRLGTVKNLMQPTVYGVGVFGIGKYKAAINGKKTKEYVLWTSMLTRCYRPQYQKMNPSYIGCSVHKDWLNFQSFARDIKKLEGYNDWSQGLNDMELDKDSVVKGNKIYSFKTCCFISSKQNCKTGNRRNKGRPTGFKYKAERILDGYTEVFYVQSEFCKKHGLEKRNVNACILGKRQKHKGWRFEILND